MAHIQRSSLAYFLGESTDEQPVKVSKRVLARQGSYFLSDTMNELCLDSDSGESDLNISVDSEEEHKPQPMDTSDREMYNLYIL